MAPVSGFVRYTIVNGETGKRFSTREYFTLPRAKRERRRLEQVYGRLFCLLVAGIAPDRSVHVLPDTETEGECS